jgi:carbon monoxide dehydrogenase subunit G
MATIRLEIPIDAQPERVWAAVRDVGAVHQRLGPGFVTDTRLDGDTRIVTFANGVVARERIVGIDDAARRIVYSVVGGRFTHDNASMQVEAEADGRSRLVWMRDMLPNELVPDITAMMEQAAGVMKDTLDRL